jgi:hypothetical protein
MAFFRKPASGTATSVWTWGKKRAPASPQEDTPHLSYIVGNSHPDWGKVVVVSGSEEPRYVTPSGDDNWGEVNWESTATAGVDAWGKVLVSRSTIDALHSRPLPTQIRDDEDDVIA